MPAEVPHLYFRMFLFWQSSVYCFYDPAYRALALGKLTALKETQFVREVRFTLHITTLVVSIVSHPMALSLGCGQSSGKQWCGAVGMIALRLAGPFVCHVPECEQHCRPPFRVCQLLTANFFRRQLSPRGAPRPDSPHHSCRLSCSNGRPMPCVRL